jgi:preprotein translocase subunit SecG
MDLWINLLVLLQVLLGLAIIGLVLLQHGKGADMGSGFGGGSSGSLFGASGSANFLSRTTAVLATIFFVGSLGLGYLVTHRPKGGGGVMDEVKTSQPAAPKPAAQVPKPAPAAPAAPESSNAKKVPN